MWPLAFMLSMSMIGLHFPLGYLLLPIILINRFKNDRYDFIIQLTIFFGGYSLMTASDVYLNLFNIIFILNITAMILIRKVPIIKHVLILCLLYAAALITFAMLSDESFAVQSMALRYYLIILYLFVPFLVFSGREFDIKILFRKLFIYAFIFCAFYLIDCIVLNGIFFLPNDPSWATYKITSTFYDPWIHPFSFSFPRRWPPGLYILLLLVYPAARYYKMNWWQWGLIIGGLMVSRTFTFTLAFIIGYIACGATGRQLVRYGFLFIVAFVALYFVDGMLGEATIEGDGDIVTKSSALRIKSQVDQFISLNEADEETLAALGTGRGAQIIPKLELLLKYDRQWIGFGFLSREMTKSNKYIIENELYGNPDEEVEVATGVESTPFQVILDIGIIGLIVHLLFFFALWFVIRKLPHSIFFLSTMLLFMFVGISGMSGLIRTGGQLMAGLAYAAVILNSKRQLPGFNLPPLRQNAVKPQLQ